MKKIVGAIAVIGLLLSSMFLHSVMGGSRAEKEAPAAMEHKGEMEEHPGKMGFLHHAMEELEEHTEKVFHAIIHGKFTELGEPARAVAGVAVSLKGTKPHNKLESIETYEGFIGALVDVSAKFERTVNEGDPVGITRSFGKVIEVCVACHANFRN
ncbi:MAG: hypothetical protein GTN70_06045 [Deltaproteobacteria bacterium]|nr:hypothetical protein [Deltaproteobacteria bacterium]NIS77241.1 hypothetical protein [Deltaproteobacteria bacterium]